MATFLNLLTFFTICMWAYYSIRTIKLQNQQISQLYERCALLESHMRSVYEAHDSQIKILGLKMTRRNGEAK